jgi:acetyl-CoA carboxylase biotin carboxyl carrier protein
MDVKQLGKITRWMEATDLDEVTWKNGTDGFSLKFQNPNIAHSSIHPSSIKPITSPSIGVFRFSKPGTSGMVQEGTEIKKEQEIGFIEVAKEHKPVISEINGFVKIICVEDGQTIEYGQPIMFIEPK